MVNFSWYDAVITSGLLQTAPRVDDLTNRLPASYIKLLGSGGGGTSWDWHCGRVSGVHCSGSTFHMGGFAYEVR